MRGGSALAAQGVYAALLRFREQPHNEELRTDFLDRLCAFVNGLPHGEHFFHNHPDAAVEAMLVLSLTKSNDAVECSQASMARQLAACLECITVYHDARSQFFSKYALIYHPDDLEQFERRLLDWDENRHLSSLERFLADLRRCKDNPSEERVVRQGTLCPIFDILNYPAPLQNRALDGMFTELLMTVQQKSRLKLRDSVFPGIVLLCVHEKTIIREWAQSCIVRAGLPIQMSKIGALSPILADIIGHLRRVIRIEPPQKSAQAMAAKCAWNFTDDEAELWRGVMCICSMVRLDSARIFFDTVAPDADRLVCSAFRGDGTPGFWQKLEFFSLVLSATECAWLSSNSCATSQRASVFSAVCLSRELNSVCQGSSDKAVAAISEQDQLRAKMFCDWMLQFLLRTPSPPDGQAPDTSWIVIELRLFFQLSHMWQPCFKNMLHVTLLLLLDSHLTTLSLTYCILGQLLADQHKCISTAMRHHVLAAVSEDANVLCLTTQPDCIGGQPQLHDDVWRGLASYDPPADLVADLLPIVAQAGFSPLICQGNSAAVSHTENNGKACSADDFSVPSAARLAASICRWIESALGDATFSVDIDTLLALLMFNDISIQQAAHKLALASTSSESYQQAVRGLVRRYSSDFLPRLFSRLSGFKKCCALYLDCLDSARGIIDLLQAVAECVVLLPDEGVVLHLGSSDSQQNPTFSTWLYSFLASFSILDAALIWAQDARFPSHDIKRLVLESLHLMRKLLPGHRSVIPEPIRVDVIRDWSEECATSLIKWTRTTDPRLRSDALSLLIDILAIATSFDATFGSELVGALSQLGGLSPHMTDEQNLVLTVWLSKQKPQSLEPDAAQALAPPSSGVMTTAAHVQATASRSHDIGNTPEPHADQWLNDDIEFDDLERLEQQALRLELGSNDEVMMTEAATLLASCAPAPSSGVPAPPPTSVAAQVESGGAGSLRTELGTSQRLPSTANGRTEIPVDLSQPPPPGSKLIAKPMILARRSLPLMRASLVGASKTGKKAAPSGKLSKLQQMRAEAALESRRLSSNRLPHGGRPQKPVAVVQIEPSEPQLVAPDPPREKRKIQTIDIPVDRPGSTRIGRLIQTAAMTGAEAKPLRSIKDLYRIVLEWDMKLDPSKRPPNLAALKLGKIPDSFRSFADYLHSFEPLLLLECWQQFVQAREELKREDSLCMVVQTLTMVTLRTPAAEIRLQQWSDNLIVLLTDVRSKASLLGRIKDISYKGAEAQVVCQTFLGNRLHLVPHVRPQSKWDAVQVFSLTTAIREYKSLLSLQSIPLSREILQPSQTRQPAPDSAKIAEYQRQLNVNIPQAKAIAAAIEQRSGFVLIQGKTKTILGLVGALQRMATSISVPSGSDAHGTRPFAAPVTNPSKRRLLCCAPSNAAIDEIARRLMDGILNAKGQLYKPSIVRVGTSAIHSDVRDVTLDAIVESRLQTDKAYQNAGATVASSSTLRADIMREMAQLKAERDNLHALESKDEAPSLESSTSTTRRISEINSRLAALRKQLDGESIVRSDGTAELERLKRNLRLKILVEADVVLTTLSGAGHDIFTDLRDCEFQTVIVDEACQSVELSCLIPLRYGARKCIMVGDPNQLPPTVLSQFAQDLSYDQSLFQRIMKNCMGSIHLLSIQYRMHPQISSFPSFHFYESQLKDAEGLEQTCAAPWHENAFFQPYKFLDVASGREQTGFGKSLYNTEEAQLCVALVKKLCWLHRELNFSSRIGVITFYKLQARKLKDTFVNHFGRRILDVIDINTVDGFQGQEKDIIFLSCVRASRDRGVGFISDVRRMNVALTRARNTLVIMGNAHSLQSDPGWRELVSDARKRGLVQQIMVALAHYSHV